MHSSFPAETPKLQLAAEQPFDRRMLEPNPTQSKKDTPQPRAKEKLQQDGRRGAAAAAAKSLQSCPTLCDLIDGNPSGSPVPGFSRQEHWSGLPFPSPMHESEK